MIGFDPHKRVDGTKIHAVVTEQSAPVAVAIGRGSEHEGKKLIPLMQSIRVKRSGRGRPRKNPKRVYADTKYGMHLNRFYLDRRKIASQIPSTARKKRAGRPRLFDGATYKKVRYTVERFFAWIENFRKLTVRYERLAVAFSGLFHIACIMILWRVLRYPCEPAKNLSLWSPHCTSLVEGYTSYPFEAHPHYRSPPVPCQGARCT